MESTLNAFWKHPIKRCKVGALSKQFSLANVRELSCTSGPAVSAWSRDSDLGPASHCVKTQICLKMILITKVKQYVRHSWPKIRNRPKGCDQKHLLHQFSVKQALVSQPEMLSVSSTNKNPGPGCYGTSVLVTVKCSSWIGWMKSFLNISFCLLFDCDFKL